jgi:CO dehydrogenase nickel-insertion accessory protein CooC1
MMKGIEMNSDGSILAGKRIGLFGKGGSGKSTAVILLARGFRERGYEVCVLDADSTNIGLPQVLGIEQTPEPLIDYFGGMVFSGGLVTCPVDDPTPLPGNEVTLDDLPIQYRARSHDGISLLIAGKIGELGPGAGCDGPVSKIARDLRIKQNGDEFVTLVDFKAGFEDSARGVITSLDWAIVLVDPTVAAVEMAFHMRNMVDQVKNGRMPATRHLEDADLVAIAQKQFVQARIKGTLFILNKVRNVETENFLRNKLADGGIQPVGVIYEELSISTSWLMGIPLESVASYSEVQRIIKKLEEVEFAYSTQYSLKELRG